NLPLLLIGGHRIPNNGGQSSFFRARTASSAAMSRGTYAQKVRTVDVLSYLAAPETCTLRKRRGQYPLLLHKQIRADLKMSCQFAHVCQSEISITTQNHRS